MNISPEIVVVATLAITIITQVLKKSPLPVNGGNAKVVALVLAVIVVLIPAYLNGGLTQQNADTLVASILLVGGAAVGAYEGIKQIYLAVKAKLKK